MTNTVDKVVLDIGKNSNFNNTQMYRGTYFQAHKMIEFMDRKRKMVNLKIAVDDAINRLDKNNKRLLTLVFFDGVKCETVAKILSVSLRTFFRKKVNALKQFELILQAIGYDTEYFEREYSKERWFMAVYDECVSKRNDSDEILDKCLVKRVFNEVSRVQFKFNTYLT